MIAILRMKAWVNLEDGWPDGMPAQVAGWILATDIDDARRQVPIGSEFGFLAQHLYRLTFDPKPGKYTLPGGFLMLVT